MQRNVENTGLIIESKLDTISMMGIYIEVKDAVVLLKKILNGDDNIVKITETGGIVGTSMMKAAGRTENEVYVGLRHQDIGAHDGCANGKHKVFEQTAGNGIVVIADAIRDHAGIKCPVRSHDQIVIVLTVVEGKHGVFIDRHWFHNLRTGQVKHVMTLAHIDKETGTIGNERVFFADGEFLKPGREDEDRAGVRQNTLSAQVVGCLDMSR